MSSVSYRHLSFPHWCSHSLLEMQASNVLHQNLNEIISLLMKKNESKKRNHKSGTSIMCVPLLLYTLMHVYNYLKVNYCVLILKILLVIFSECIKHSTKYQVVFKIVLDDTNHYRGNTSGFLLFWLLFFSVIYFCIQLKFIIIEQASVNVSCNISPFSCQLIITLTSLLLLRILFMQIFLLTHEKF